MMQLQMPDPVPPPLPPIAPELPEPGPDEPRYTSGRHRQSAPTGDPRVDLATQKLEKRLGPCAGAGEGAGKAGKRPNTRWYLPQGLGRNTRRAASDPSSPARAATNSRSNSGTNSDVRAPECVGMRVSK